MPVGRVLSKDIQGYRDEGKGRERRDGRREREGGGKEGERRRGEERREEEGEELNPLILWGPHWQDAGMGLGRRL